MTNDFFAISQDYKKRIEDGEGEILQTIKRYSLFTFFRVHSLRESIRIDEKNRDYFKNVFLDGEKDVPLELLGYGTRNIAYRLGKLESDLFLATRSFKDTSLVSSIGDHNRTNLEIYAKECERYNKNSYLTSKLLIGVRVHLTEELSRQLYASNLYNEFPNMDDFYFLIVQDFTDGGNNREFIPASSGRKFGRYNNQDVYYDFNDFGLSYFEENDFKFMAEDAMIHVHLK